MSKIIYPVSYGYLEYDPQNNKTRQEPWWLILKCSVGLMKMYHYFIEREASKVVSSKILGKHIPDFPLIQTGVKVGKSAWGPHISITRGEEPKNKNIWKKYVNRKIYFAYDPNIINQDSYWFLKVHCNLLYDIRTELGLSPLPLVPFHLTIGVEGR